LYPVTIEGKDGYIDRAGKVVIPAQFDQARGHSEGLAAVSIGGNFGFIDRAGKLVIAPQFAEARWFQNGCASVMIGQRWGFIDKSGRFIGDGPVFRFAGAFSGGLAPVELTRGEWAFVDRSGKAVWRAPVTQLLPDGFIAGLAPAADANGRWGFLDPKGKWAIPALFDKAGHFADGVAPVEVAGRTGYINRKGEFQINPRFTSGAEFHEGLAAVTIGDKAGYINTRGETVVEPNYKNGNDFAEGLAAVQLKDGLWGFIDRTGKMVIAPQFDDADRFWGGLGRVKVFDVWTYVNPAGVLVYKPFPAPTIAAERARRQEEAAREIVARRLRLLESFAGLWTGWFNNDPASELLISFEQGALSATLVTANWEETFDSELLPDGTLVLTGKKARPVGHTRSASYSLDTLRLAVDAGGIRLTGEHRDAQGQAGRVSFARRSP
jgi:hypothetical protein